MEYRNAICYSGYREGQNPREGIYPSYNQVKEDLLILSKNWSALRLYDCSTHARLVLDVIQNEGLDFKVMLGADVAAEMNNPGCPWGAQFSEEELQANREANEQEIERLIDLANAYPDTVGYVSVGNEASVEWTDHLISVEKLVEHVKRVKAEISQPVTFCENYVPWTYKLDELVAELDFISLHTYPVWEYKTIDDALGYTKDNYFAVANRYPDKPVIITEAGWATASNGRGIEAWNASEEIQAAYYEQLLDWTRSEKILTFVFEAFDEPWKGDAHPEEPEKHWGLFKEDRTPKLVMQGLFG
ncbi:glycosyl hydrolase [Enterovibrio norvegicus FF-33]|uniref:Endo-1,3-beta-glucanase btgC n=1 Tax=Enterovibrio norvegicus FF-454 TaxID=1185651 RepID=A0A1E5BY76_9GAMM|nr:glycosyl hydrolase family 17 protein [Enterovibrio norvegicus]OEE58159.1 glycosyl hydrolase [Enterovibrio norvegicus FF-454]OEE66023.1 glycosyl hydrolase [Enterovibrio norvegicus FF-33]OEE75122.1 glycosyl hydrolase [Enterovibrio norvegicus FF-162]